MASPDQASGQLNPPSSVSSASDPWKERIFIPTLLAGIAGGAFGLISKHRKAHGLQKISATYATNFALVAGCYCGAREFMRVSRTYKPDDLLNSAIGGFASGALLGRLQGGRAGAIRYSLIFSVVGTAVDYAAIKLKPAVIKLAEKKDNWLKLPEWSPIQVLDEEAIAAKQAREEEAFRRIHNLKKEES